MSTANTVPYIFAGQTGNIPLSELDANFANAKSAADFVIQGVQANITQVGTLNGLNVLGEARADFFVGNGSQLTGVTGTVVGVLPSLEVSGAITTGSLEAGTTIEAFGNITSEGNVVALERIIAVGNVSGNYILGNGRALVGILYSANALTGNTLANTVENSSLTSVGVLSNLSVSGTIAGNIQSDSIAAGNITVSNNATANFFIGDGSQLTNIVANTLGNITSINVPGNIVGGNLLSNGNLVLGGNARALGNVQGTFFIGNGSQLTGVTNYTNANVITLLAGFGANTISTSGNITAGRLFGNGSGITGLPPTYTDANVATLLASFGANTISTSGNVTTGNISGDFAVFDHLDVAGNITGDLFQTQIVTGNSASFTGNVTVGNLITATAGTPTVSSTGNLVLSANGAVQVTSPLNATSTISATGNITGGNISTAGTVSATGNITGGNISTAGTVTATANIVTDGFFVGNLVGNISSNSNIVLSAVGEVQISELAVANTIFATSDIITDGFFIGNFSGNIVGTLTNIPGPSGAVVYNNGSGNAAATAGLVFDNSGPNVLTVLGTYSATGNIAATGNITGSYLLGNGSQLTGLPATYSNANVVTLMAAFGSNTISSTGNITTTANISGGFILGNGSQLTGLPVAYGNSNVVTLLANFGLNNINTTGNVQSDNLFLTGNILDIGALTISTGSNGNLNLVPNGTGIVTASSNVSVTGNISGNYFIGNGALLTGITSGSSYTNANVVTLMAAFGSNVISSTGNITTTANITAGNIGLSGNITDSGALSIITGSNGNINLVPNGTGIVTTSELSVAGNVTVGNLITATAGTPTISSTSNLVLSSPTVVNITGGGTFRLPQLDSSQIANIVAVNGDLVYNTTANKIQGYENGAWGNLI